MFSGQPARRIPTSQQTRGNITHIAFYTRDLTRKKQVFPLSGLQGRQQLYGGENESITMHLAIPGELSSFQPGDQTQNSALFREFEVGLKSDQVVERSGEVILTQLHHRMGTLSGTRIAQPDRPQRAKSESILPAPGEHFDGQTALEEFM